LLESGAVMLIEWPERILEALPPEHLRLTLRWLDETKRNCWMNARGTRYEDLLRTFRKNAFGR
jgi:tRNA A37 threonylcarbamoyladenosine biosynthesis protein TsaE